MASETSLSPDQYFNDGRRREVGDGDYWVVEGRIAPERWRVMGRDGSVSAVFDDEAAAAEYASWLNDGVPYGF